MTNPKLPIQYYGKVGDRGIIYPAKIDYEIWLMGRYKKGEIIGLCPSDTVREYVNFLIEQGLIRR